MGAILHIAVISNITLEPYFIPLLKSYFKETKLIVNPIPYGEHENAVYQKQLMEADLVIVWLNFETLFPDRAEQFLDDYAAFCKDLYADLTRIFDGKILWLSFEDYYIRASIVMGHRYDALIDKVNIKLAEFFYDRAKFIDLKRLITEVGIVGAYDPSGKYRWNAPYSKVLIEAVVKEIHKQYLIEKGITEKCLILDCDNVLWGGILSEDGVENIKLGGSGFGRAYQDFQRFVLSLYYHGVILAVCSKNDLSDVMMMFREHSEMVLKEGHIACFQVNWENKPDNIKRISETLNIGLNSMVFVDDSLAEVEAVKSMLPEVSVIRYERDMAYEQFSCFNLKSNVSKADIEKRNETYRTNRSREALKSEYDSYADYINALEIKIDIHEATPLEFSRISELTQRTNKCTNGKRYTVAEVKKRAVSKSIKLYSLSVSDRFSDLGLVGALEVEGETLTLFSLSCRALGREIEGKMLDFITDKHRITKIEFKPTGKNETAKMMLLGELPYAVLTSHENA